VATRTEEQVADNERVVGLVGLGQMGARMAATLIRGGWRVVGWDLLPAGVEAAARDGLVPAADPAAVAAAAPIVITSLPDITAVRAVVLGERGLAGGGRDDLLVVDTSTATASDARAFAGELAALGIAFLDAPVTGGPGGAATGHLGVMVGGAAADVERARAVLETIGATVVHCGPSGSGQVVKACNQLIVVATLGAVGEALVMARAAGVDPAAAREALMAGYARSQVLEGQGLRMLTRDFTPGGKARFNLKDVAALAELSVATGVRTPVFDTAAAYIRALVDGGGGDLDHSAIVTVIEEAVLPPGDPADAQAPEGRR
jgi:2-hydroxy-3-oxopropionate reductase